MSFTRKWIAFLACILSISSHAQAPTTSQTNAIDQQLIQQLTPHPATQPGQTATQLADGSWLLTGGQGSGISGSTNTASTSAILINSSGAATTLPSGLLQARSNHSATLLPNGQVLILGGVDSNGNVLPNAEQYDPIAHSFTSLGNPGLIPRSGHSATVLSDGRLLIAGGSDAHGQAVLQLELLTPGCASCAPQRYAAQLDIGRPHPAAALLPNGSVLLWGSSSDNSSQASGELIDPSTQSLTPESPSAAQQLAQSLTNNSPGGSPGINTSQPVNDAGNTPLDQALMVRFAQRMAIASLNNTSTTLIGPTGPIATRVVGLQNGTLVFITPQQNLLPNTRYTLFLQGATDANGQSLPFTAIGFTTATLNSNTGTTLVTPGIAGPSATGTNNAAPASGATTVGIANSSTTATSSTITPLGTDDETWTPQAANYHGLWTSSRAAGAQQHPPKRLELQRAYRETELKRDGRISFRQRQALLPAIKQASAPAGVTALVGQTLKLNGQPLAGVTISIGNQHTTTDDNGEFLLTNIPSGEPPAASPMLQIDGRSASSGTQQYGRYFYQMHIKVGQVNTMSQPIWMVKLDNAHAVNISAPTTSETVITNPQLPGLEIHLPAGAVVRDADGNIVTQVSLTPVPADQLPFPMPYGQLPVYYTLQPGGAVIQSVTGKALGAKVIYPNYSTQPPGAKFQQFDYDPKGRGWYVYGTATVAADGKHLTSDKDFVLYQFTASSVASSGGNPSKLPPLCMGGAGGEPVSCHDGIFFENYTDLALTDILPVALQRSYHSGDSNQHSFGIGGSDDYDSYLYFADSSAEGSGYTTGEIDIVMGDGSSTPFLPVSSNINYLDPTAVWQSTTPGPFYMAKISIAPTQASWGNNFLVTLKDGTVYNYSYYQAQLMAIQDRWGNTTGITRDNNGRMIQATSPNGRSISFQYNAPSCSSCISQATDNTGRQVSYQYDPLGNLIKVTDVAGGITTYSYDPQSNNMITVNDPRNNSGQITQPKVTNLYYTLADGVTLNGRVKQQTYADGSTTQFAYAFDSNGIPTQTIVTDQLGNVRNLQYTAGGEIAQETFAQGQPEQQTTTNTWNASTQLLQSSTDALGRQTTYQYDATGNITQITRLSGTANAVSTSYTYTAAYNQLASYTDELQHTTNLSYDTQGNLTQIKDANGNITTFTATASGQIATVTNALGNTISLAYDKSDLVKITDALSHAANITTDAAGRTIQITNPLGNIRQAKLDALDRTTQAIDALNKTTGISYDPNSNLTQVKDANSHTHSYAYDNTDNLSGYTDPLNQSETYQYDSNHNLTQKTDRKGQATKIAYDHLNRPIGITFADNSSINATYDAGNRLTKIVDSQNGTINYGYDNLDNLTSVSTATGGVSYTYYANGLRQSMTANGQPTISYTYDAGNRLTRITQAAGAVNNNTAQTISYSYDSINRRTQTTLPNGIAMNYSYDNANRLTGITYLQGSSTIGNLTYGYDAAGHRTSMGGSFARATATPASTSTVDAANRLIQFNGTSMTYDANGNLTNDGSNTYTWNARNQLTQITGATTATFSYDALGRRTSKTINGVISNYLYDGANIIGETTTGSTFLTGLGIDETLAMESGSGAQVQVASYLTDALGSTIRLADQNGNKLVDYTYSMYGITTADAASNNPFQYTGRENDGDGLYYYRARYYNPALPRFISSDPTGLRAGINTYRYAGSNPIQFKDASGLNTIQAGLAGTATAGIVGGIAGFGIAIDSEGNIAGYFYTGGGVGGGLNEGAGASVQVSNAKTIDDLGGWFTNSSLSGGAVVGGTADQFFGDSDHGTVIGGGITVGEDVGVSGVVARSYTWLTPSFNPFKWAANLFGNRDKCK